jgi:hypothetical protein
LAALDKQIARRQEDTKLIPERAAHLNWRSLARINYSQAARQQASADVEHLSNVRDEMFDRLSNAANCSLKIVIWRVKCLMSWTTLMHLKNVLDPRTV